MTYNVPEAVRLGERILAENGDVLEFEVGKAVKDWLINHNKEYVEAMKVTGPYSVNSIYKTPLAQQKDQWSHNSIVNPDDPYW